MQYKPETRTEIEVWAGLNTNVDSHDGGKGEMEEQTNITCVVAGQLTVRGGMQPVIFEN